MTVQTETRPHPAKFSDALLPVFDSLIRDYLGENRDLRVFDPFAGTGKIHALDFQTVGVEIEPEWADAHPRTRVGNSLALPPSWTATFDAVVTSPCYGNRMADHHEARDACSRCEGSGLVPPWSYGNQECSKCGGSGLSPRKTYRHSLDRMPDARSSATLHWGDEYRAFHEQAWAEVYRVLRPRGLFVLNVKDHIKDGERQRVSAWHRRTVESIGFARLETVTVPLRGMRHGANYDARLDVEYVYAFRRDARKYRRNV